MKNTCEPFTTQFMHVHKTGERIFTTVSHIQYINSIDNSVVISCPASDSRKYVTLHKLNEEVCMHILNKHLHIVHMYCIDFTKDERHWGK